MKEINLEEILLKHTFNSTVDTLKEDSLSAMKEACKQVLELAAENAYCNHEFDGAHECEYSVNKESITNTINQVK